MSSSDALLRPCCVRIVCLTPGLRRAWERVIWSWFWFGSVWFGFSSSQQITCQWLTCPHPVFGNLVRWLQDAVVASAKEASVLLACLVDSDKILFLPPMNFVSSNTSPFSLQAPSFQAPVHYSCWDQGSYRDQPAALCDGPLTPLESRAQAGHAVSWWAWIPCTQGGLLACFCSFHHMLPYWVNSVSLTLMNQRLDRWTERQIDRRTDWPWYIFASFSSWILFCCIVLRAAWMLIL